MFSNQSAELSLNAPCKSVAAVLADRMESRFLVGTCSIQDYDSNQLHVIRYHSDVNVVGVDASLVHPTGPIQQIIPSPQDATLVMTVAEQATQATLWKIPSTIMEMTNEISMMDSETTATDYGGGGGSSGVGGLIGDSYHDSIVSHGESSISNYSTSSTSGGILESRLTIDPNCYSNNDNNSNAKKARLLDLKWRNPTIGDLDDTATPGDVVTLDERGILTQWDVSMGLAESMHTLTAVQNETAPVMARPKVAWDPHHASSLAVSWGRSIRFLDLRSQNDTGISSSSTSMMARAHRYGVTDMDYNPNKPYTLATSGLDGLVHYWDIRTTRRPLLSARGGHSHYAWCVQYNPFHDQLVLSTGTDAIVNLWRVSTISSAPLLTIDDGAVPTRSSGDADAASETSAPNVRVARHELSDAVYSAAWGAADAWMYMTVAYDGKVALHHVPSKEKYKILL